LVVISDFVPTQNIINDGNSACCRPYTRTYNILTQWHYLFLKNRFLVGVVCNISHVDVRS